TVGHGDRDTRGGRRGAPLALRRDDARARPSVPAPPAPILHPAAGKWRQPCPCASDTLHPGCSAAAIRTACARHAACDRLFGESCRGTDRRANTPQGDVGVSKLGPAERAVTA